MTKFSMKVEGLEKLQHKLANIQLDEATRNRALMAGGKHMRNEISKNTPVGQTGKLKESIATSEVSSDGKILIGPSQQGPDFRAHFPEFGTSKMKAQPYMRPTYEREIKEAERIMGDEVKKGLGL